MRELIGSVPIAFLLWISSGAPFRVREGGGGGGDVKVGSSFLRLRSRCTIYILLERKEPSGFK